MSDRKMWDALWDKTGQRDANHLRLEVECEERSIRCRHILTYMTTQGMSPASMSVVEVGSGSGIYSTILARRGAKVTALDQSRIALDRVSERGEALAVEISTMEGDAKEVSRDHAGQFDMAMSFGTVEHFREPQRFEMCKAHWDLVRPGGIVVISVPNILFLPHEILKIILRMRGKWFLGYEGSFTPWELERVGRRLGLKSVELSGTDACKDTVKYWEIIKGTSTWRKWFPWWGSKKADRISGTVEIYGRLRRGVNLYLGHDITLIGLKGA